MDIVRNSPLEFPVKELDQELIARGAQVPDEEKFKFKDREGTPARNACMTGAREVYKKAPPPYEALSDFSTWEVAKILVFKTRSGMDFTRGASSNDIMDWFEISDEYVDKNAGCVAAICLKDNLIDNHKGFSTLKVKNYGKTFNLCDLEPFRDQPVSAGFMCTGFLVKEDVIATAAHCVKKNKVTDLRIVFGFKMTDSSSPVTTFSPENIYQGLEIIRGIANPDEGDWALVKLDRKVVGQAMAKLSKEAISRDQPVYVIGHPLGLPLKYAGGAAVCDNTHETYFTADLNIYSSSSGSPVFALDSHEVIGMVLRGENSDFRWTGKGWMSVQYPEGKKAAIMKIATKTPRLEGKKRF